jgi:hypothetical protein
MMGPHYIPAFVSGDTCNITAGYDEVRFDFVREDVQYEAVYIKTGTDELTY